MAPRTFIGVDATGAACLKIMNDAADNPVTTPDSAVHKFRYNSKYDVIPEIAGLVYPFDGPNYATGGGWVYYPSGRNHTNFDYAVRGLPSFPTYREIAPSMAYYANLDYRDPLFMEFLQRPGDNEFVNTQTVTINQGVGNGGFVACGATAGAAWFGGAQWVETGSSWEGTFPSNEAIWNTVGTVSGGQAAAQYPPYTTVTAFWNLPANNVPLNDAPTLTPVSGQKSIKINPGEFKVAKPGYSVDTATGSEVAFSSERRPVKIIKSGDVLLAGGGGTLSVDLGITVSDKMVAYVHCYVDGGAVYWPAHPLHPINGVTYRFSGQSIVFTNNNQTCRVRYFVIAEDDQPATSGTNKVFQQFTAGGEEVVQILSPGSADPPRLADIVIDSRWPMLTLLDEGWFDVSNGAQVHTATFSNPGMLPMVVYNLMCVRAEAPTFLMKKAPYVKRFRHAIYEPDRQAGDSTYAEINPNGTEVKFYTYRGRPVDSYYRNLTEASAFIRTVVPDPFPIFGLRYYVFGIPPI